MQREYLVKTMLRIHESDKHLTSVPMRVTAESRAVARAAIERHGIIVKTVTVDG